MVLWSVRDLDPHRERAGRAKALSPSSRSPLCLALPGAPARRSRWQAHRLCPARLGSAIALRLAGYSRGLQRLWLPALAMQLQELR